MLRIIIGSIIFAIGVFLVVKTEAMLKSFGRIIFFEKHFGQEGGSRLGYKMIGLFFIFIGSLVITGMINGFMEWMLSPLLKYNR
jgi:hypothetical protein